MIETLEKLRSARRPEDVFGNVDEAAAHSVYTQIARAVHPDRHPGHADLANEAMRLLNEWWGRFKRRGKAPAGPVVISVGKRRYTITAPLAAGEIADLHYAHDATGAEVILKICRNAADNDLMQNERDALQKIEAAGFGDMRTAYPVLRGSFQLDGRNVTVLEKPAAELVPLQKILEAYPGGIDARDMIWMWKRALGAVGLAHHIGLVHGGLLHPHILLDLTSHGVHLVGWTASAAPGSKIRLKSIDYTEHYPDETPAASPQLDLYMLATTMMDVAPIQPIGLRRLLGMCVAPEIERRPLDTLVFHRLVDQVARECFGPPVFRPFTIGRASA